MHLYATTNGQSKTDFDIIHTKEGGWATRNLVCYAGAYTRAGFPRNPDWRILRWVGSSLIILGSAAAILFVGILTLQHVYP